MIYYLIRILTGLPMPWCSSIFIFRNTEAIHYRRCAVRAAFIGENAMLVTNLQLN